MGITAGSSGKTSTSYVESSLQGINRPHDKRSVVEAIEFIGREDTPLLSKLSTGQKAGQNRHSWLQRKVSEADRKPVAEVSGFTGGKNPTTQRLDNATEIFKHEDWISQAAKDTVTYGASEQSLMERDLVLKHKKTMEQAVLGIGRKVITGTSDYTYTSLDADPAIAAKMSLIAAPKFRSGDGTNAANASQMAGIFHFLANTGKPQAELDAGTFRNLTTGFSNKWMGNIRAFDSAYNNTGTKQSIDRKNIHELIRKMTDYGVNPANGAFDLYCGGDLLETITDMYKDNRRGTMTDKEIGYQVETIVTPFGKARIQYHPDFTDANGLGDVILVGNFSYLQKAYLTETTKSNPSTDQTADLIRYYSDMTLVVKNAYAFAAGFGLKA